MMTRMTAKGGGKTSRYLHIEMFTGRREAYDEFRA